MTDLKAWAFLLYIFQRQLYIVCIQNDPYIELEASTKNRYRIYNWTIWINHKTLEQILKICSWNICVYEIKNEHRPIL